jgi:DNA-binding response OmpR family regulator
MRVLIVDDDMFVRRLVRTLLETEGMECYEADDGKQALEAARELRPDIIVLDVMLPSLNGYEICRTLKFDENFSDIPIVMLTSRSEPTDKETGYYTGADVYLTKPFEHKELVEAIKHLAGSRIGS